MPRRPFIKEETGRARKTANSQTGTQHKHQGKRRRNGDARVMAWLDARAVDAAKKIMSEQTGWVLENAVHHSLEFCAVNLESAPERAHQLCNWLTPAGQKDLEKIMLHHGWSRRMAINWALKQTAGFAEVFDLSKDLPALPVPRQEAAPRRNWTAWVLAGLVVVNLGVSGWLYQMWRTQEAEQAVRMARIDARLSNETKTLSELTARLSPLEGIFWRH